MPQFVSAFRALGKISEAPSLQKYTEIVDPPLTATDDELEQHIRNNTSTVFHPVGTAKMGSLNDPMSVVDSNLCVRDVTGLRVVDASVMPKVVRGHTMAATILIGERTAELITEKAQ